MFDIGWTEMLVVAVVAILFVGPKELPGMLRTFGRSIKKLRSMAGDFQKQFDEALKDAELDGVKDALNEVRDLNPVNKIKDHLNPIKQDLEDTKKTLQDSVDFDPRTVFDESKLPKSSDPVKVDVDAALKRQQRTDAAKKAKLAAKAKPKNPYKPAAKKTAAKQSAAPKKTSKAAGATKATAARGTKKAVSRTKAKPASTKAKPVSTKAGSTKSTNRKAPAKRKNDSKASA